MKLYLLITLLALTGTNQKCNKEGSVAIPSCIQQKIESIKAQPKWNPPAEVHEYKYAGKRVFLFSANCCDQYSELYDENCNYICAPSGGITGKGDRKCDDFLQNAKEVKLIWKDDR
jgi:hypothetical protein